MSAAAAESAESPCAALCSLPASVPSILFGHRGNFSRFCEEGPSPFNLYKLISKNLLSEYSL